MSPSWIDQFRLAAMCVQISQNALQKGFDGLVLDNGLTSPNVTYQEAGLAQIVSGSQARLPL